MEQEDVKVKILKNIVFVAGHPRSGTSLACQLLESAGVKFPSDFRGDEYNHKGYYEILSSKELSKKLIKEAMTVENTIEMNKIVDRLNEYHAYSGLKLVRIAALFFYRHISKNMRAVFVFRNPADVKASLLRRGIAEFRPNWLENNNALIAAYENTKKSIIISFETLINGGENVKNAFDKIDFDIELNIIKPEQRTQKKSRMLITNEEKRLYNVLKELEAESLGI